HSIATFPNVTKPWVARKGLNPQMVEALKATLLEVNDASALAPLKIDGFVEGSEEDFSFIRKAMEVNEQFFQ
ncbi:MAG: hypothetical protein KDD60_06840, partial [Bdellovibrionales bacterium]|nr:hypothetical protein [Bdellovibrionales bacterium]